MKISPYTYPGLIKEYITTKDIIYLVEKETCTSLKDLKGKSRKGVRPKIRHLLCYLLDKYTNLSHGGIAEIIERDRTTAIFSIRSAPQYMEISEKFNKWVKNVEHLILLNYRLLPTSEIDKYKKKGLHSLTEKKSTVKKGRKAKDDPRVHIPEKEKSVLVRPKAVYSNQSI